MSSRDPSNDPSTNHRAAPAGNDGPHQASSEEQRLSYYRSNTTKLLEFLKRSDQDSIDRFIAVVRSGASHDDVFATIEQLRSSTGEYSSTDNGDSQ